MFDDDDPILGRVRAMAFDFPGSAEKVSHGRPAFFTKKVFAYFGASVRLESGWVQHGQSIVVAVDPGEHVAMLAEDRFFLPAYFGVSGWVGLDLDRSTDWAEVAELLDASYRLTAPAKLVAQLDASPAAGSTDR